MLDSPGVQPDFRVGLIADCQYCAAEAAGQRYYRRSPEKLSACVEHFNRLDLAYVIHLGDFIDRDFESFDVVMPIYGRLLCAKHHVLGNHDFGVADERKADVPGRLDMPARNYDFAVQDWHFIVLDGNDISLHAHPKGSPEYLAAVEYHALNAPDDALWNGAIGPDQLAWLNATLQRATDAKERVILYSHFPVFPEDVHNLWNAEELLEVIDAYPCIQAHINGHNHAGNYATRDGVHFLTLKGMVDTLESSYAVLEFHAQHLTVLGFGRESNRTLTLR